MNLTGVFPPLTTPFEGDKFSVAMLQDNIARYEQHNLAGYLLLGSTGEAAYLEKEEKLEVLRAARDVIPPDKVLIAGVGLETTSATISLAKAAADKGADLLLVLTPFYFRSRMTSEALLRHFNSVADASPVPILVYNVPKFTGLSVAPATMAALARHENIIGMKDSTGDLGWMMDVRSRVDEDFKILCGGAAVFQPALEAGACGGILAAADVLPEPFISILERTVEGNSQAALTLQRGVLDASKLIVNTTGVPGIKAAVGMRGLHGGPPRRPMLPPSAEEMNELERTLDILVADQLIPAREI